MHSESSYSSDNSTLSHPTLQINFELELTSQPTLQISYMFQIQTIDTFDGLAWNISGDMGLVSAGRINKDTPPLTTPSHTSKSSAMDTSSYIF
jgi:hypothetical protein